MDLTFKVLLQKTWTLRHDRLIYGNQEILLSDIQSAKLFCDSNKLINGVIQVVVSGQTLTLAFTNKSKADAHKALEYLQENCNNRVEVEQTPTKKYKKTLEDVKAEIDALPIQDSWGTRKEIKELPEILSLDETIKAMTSGLTDGTTWLIVCTNRRVIMLDKGMVYGLKLIDIPLDRINSISQTKGLTLGTISITDGAVTRTIENISNNTIGFFANTVNKEIELYKQAKNAPAMQPVQQVINTPSAADEVLKLKELLDMGVLTQEEFDMKKKELLGL